MDYIQKAQQTMNKNNEYNLELNTKFGILYKNQMLNELEHQSLQIRELLQLKEKHEKMIYILKQEIETHKKVEQIIAKKKEEYLEMTKKKFEKENVNKSKEKDNKKLSKNIPLLNIKNNDNCLTESNLYNFGKFRIMNKKEYHDYKSLEKVYKQLLEDYNYIKNEYSTLKDKEKNFQDKYKGILNLFNEALEDLLKNEEIKKKENIYIDINELNKGNYEKYTKEEKYYILVVIINHLLPFIQIKENEKYLSSIKDKINNIEFKMNKTQITRFTDSSRSPTVNKPFLGITSNNFYNISTNTESNINSERQHFVSIFGDDFIQYGKNIFNDKTKINIEKQNFEKFWKKKNKMKDFDSHSNNIRPKLVNYSKIKSFIDSSHERKIEPYKKKIESSSDKKDYKKIGYKRVNTFDRKLVRVMIVE